MDPYMEAGVKIGYLVGQLSHLDRETGELRQRVARLAPELQFTFALMQTGSVMQLMRTVDPEDVIRLSAGVLGCPEKQLRDELDSMMELAREKWEEMGLE